MSKVSSVYQRAIHLDILAGVLIVYMVYVHICQLFQYDNNVCFKCLQHIFGFFMPWFFFKGGMFYHDGLTTQIIKSGFRRLITPYILWTSIGVAILSIIRYYHGIPFDFLRCVKGSVGCMLLTGSVRGNLPLWFLLTLFCSRILFHLSRKCKLPSVVVLVACFIGGFLCNKFSIDTPKYLANTLTGTMFYAGGYLLRSKQYNRYYTIFSFVIFIAINYFAYTYVGIRNNKVLDGYYLLWPLFSFSGIILFNNVFSLIENYRENLLIVVKPLAYIGVHSLLIYVIHWPILLVLKELIN